MHWLQRLQQWWERHLWGAPDESPIMRRHPLRYVLRILTLTTRAYTDNRLLLHAADLSYFTALSVVPFLGFSLVILNIFQISGMVRPFLLGLATGGNPRLLEALSGFIDSARISTLGSLGLALLFLLGFLMLQRVKTALNRIWGVAHRPAYASRVVEYAAALVLAPLVLTGTFAATTYLASFERIAFIQQNTLLAQLSMSTISLSSVLLLLGVLLYAYYMLPDTRVSITAALVGALAAALLIAAAQGYVVRGFYSISGYNLIYGAFAVLPFMMIWFYLAWSLFLLGAQLSFSIQNYSVLRQSPHGMQGDRRTEPYAILTVLVLLLDLFEETGKPVRLGPLARRADLSQGALRQILQRLADKQFITRVEGRRAQYVPRERMETVTLADALDRLRTLPRFAERPPTKQMVVLDAVSDVLRDVNDTVSGKLSRITVQTLLERHRSAMVRPADH